MSGSRVSRGLTRAYVGGSQEQTQRIQTQTIESLNRIADALFMNGHAIFGLPDATLPGGITDGITFTTGQTRDIPHNMGREAAGFVVIDVRTNAASIKRETTGLDALLKKTHIRLTHTGATTTLVKLWVY